MRQRELLRRLLGLLTQQKGAVVLALIGVVLQVSSALIVPILIGKAIDVIASQQGDLTVLPIILWQLFTVVLLGAVAQWGTPRLYHQIIYDAMRTLRQALFAKIHRLQIAFLDGQTVGDLLSRLTTDMEQLSEGLLMVFNQLFVGILTIMGILGVMARFDRIMLVLVVVLTPLSLVVARFIADRSYQLFKYQTMARGAQTQFMEESIHQQTTIQLFNGQPLVSAQFQQLNAEYVHYSQRATFYSSIVNPMTRFVNALIYAVLAGFGAWRIVNGVLSVGELTIFLNYANQYTKPFNDISSVLTELQGAFACAERLFELLDVPEHVAVGERQLEAETLQGEIVFDNVSFSYSLGQPVIQGLSFVAPAGSKIAIVGPTGAGKSTLINLLTRFYDVQKGSILLDGVSITDYAVQSLRAQMGMVMQETWLSSGTIHDNIAFANPNLTREEVVQAAILARADMFIRQLPNGYDTLISDADSLLSQGQRQLLTIARVFAQKPQVLLLDEATASIDTRTEVFVQQAFESLMTGRTSFIIAHRLSTIQTADLILVMNKGQVVEQGTHATLMAQRGFYWRMQQAVDINQ